MVMMVEIIYHDEDWYRRMTEGWLGGADDQDDWWWCLWFNGVDRRDKIGRDQMIVGDDGGVVCCDGCW